MRNDRVKALVGILGVVAGLASAVAVSEGPPQPRALAPYISRELGVMVHSAEPRRVNQITVENFFLRAIAQHHREWLPQAPAATEITEGRFALDSSAFRTTGIVGVPFSLPVADTYSYFLPSNDLLARLRTLNPALPERLAVVGADGQPMERMELPRIAAADRAFRREFFVLQRREAAPEERAPAEAPLFDMARSYIIEIASRNLIEERQRLLRDAIAVAGPNPPRPTAEQATRAWALGRAEYERHYDSIGILVELAHHDAEADGAPEFRRVGDYLLVVHKIQSSGHLVLPVTDVPGNREAGDETPDPIPVAGVVRRPVQGMTPAAIIGGNIDFAEFLRTVLVDSNLLSDDETTEYECVINAQRAADTACKRSGAGPQARYHIEFRLPNPAAPPHGNSFRIRDTGRKDVWDVRLTTRAVPFSHPENMPVRNRVPANR